MIFKEQISAWKSLPRLEKISMGYLWYIVFGVPLILLLLNHWPISNFIDHKRQAVIDAREKRLADPETRDEELKHTYVMRFNDRDDSDR